MSRPTRMNPEGFTARPSEMAWGCVPQAGWVPYPPKISRRHALLDTVGKTDDPCDRPKHEPPTWEPKPAFKPPREGYPNDMCNLDDYSGDRGSSSDEFPDAMAVIDVGKGTSQSIHVTLPAAVLSNTSGEVEPPTIDECCESSRSLDVVRSKYEDVVGPLEERESGHSRQFTKCMSPCQPLLPKYPCRGVIDDLPDETGWTKPTELEAMCKPRSLQNGQGDPGKWQDQPPLSVGSWEFIDKCRTCDYYPIQQGLASRFNHPAWFKGYGCEKPAHPFYVTTTSDYGRFSPNPHTMTQMYFPRSGAFTEVLAVTGMYRNRTLNTSNNKTIV